ncbi:hypothetical protein JBE04_01410 [Streptomyces sp. PRKS01-29]|nr:hypothetical protein [Streptomyces sabulosicollis]MBI0293186.1 hypothetical protein [Streptomyces sabulosicollis]
MRTDSTHVLAAVRRLNRGELVAETLRTALEELSEPCEEWLARLVTREWADRYGRPVGYDRLPRGGDALIAYVLKVGEDGMHILRAVYQGDAPPGLRDLLAVQVLRQVWVQQYWYDGDGQLRGRGPKSTRDRAADGQPSRGTPARPRRTVGLIPPRHECHGPVDRIHQGLTAQGFQPTEHVVDGGYVTPDSVHRAEQRWGIGLLGPVRDDPRASQRPYLPKRTSASTGRPAP